MNSVDQVKLGLIGFGKWVREAYVPILKELSTVSVTAVAARTAATRKLAVEQLGPAISAYEDYRDLLGNDDVQAVAIALPNELHTEVLEAALLAGKHVFIEPPIGLTRQDTQRAMKAVSSSDRVVQVDLELRYLPVIEFVRQQIQASVIGDRIMAKVRLWCDWAYGGVEQFREAGSQGFFLWLGCWYLDVLDCVFETAATEASVTGGYAMNDALMDHGFATMKYANGGIGQFEFNLVAVQGTQISLHIAGTKGELEADLLTGTCRWRQSDGAWQQVSRPCTQPVHGFAGMRESITGFLDALLQAVPTQTDVQICQRVHQAALACTQSETEGQTVCVRALDEQ